MVKSLKFNGNLGYVYQRDVYDGGRKTRAGGQRPALMPWGFRHNLLIVKIFHCGPRGTTANAPQRLTPCSSFQ